MDVEYVNRVFVNVSSLWERLIIAVIEVFDKRLPDLSSLSLNESFPNAGSA